MVPINNEVCELNPSNRKSYIIVLIFCFFIIVFAQIEYSVVGPSIAQGFNKTSSVGQSVIIPQGLPSTVLQLGSTQTSGETSQGTTGQSGQQDWKDSSSTLGQTSLDSDGQSNQEDWMGSSLSDGQSSQVNTGRSTRPSWMDTSSNSGDATSLQLWIQELAGKSQYEIYHIGTAFQLLAYTPAKGVAELYELSLQSETMKSKKYQLIAGYNSILLRPDQSGRHIFLFTMNDRPSNAVIIDIKDSVSQMGSNVGGIPAATPMD